MREIGWRIESIIDRKNLDKKFHASLHGCEINAPKVKEEEVLELGEEKEQMMKDAIEKAKQRKAKQYGK